MNRREFNTVALAALTAAGLPIALGAEIGPPGDDPGPKGVAGLPGVERAYLTATGGRSILKTARSVGKSTATPSSQGAYCIEGVVISCVGYLPGKPELYCLGQAFINPIEQPVSVVSSFERLRQVWAPRECLVEANGLAETLLGSQPGVVLVSEKTEVQLDLSEDPVVKDRINVVVEPELGWCLVGAREPDHGEMLRKVFPVRRVYGDVEGEALLALRASRTLARIYRRLLESPRRDLRKVELHNQA